MYRSPPLRQERKIVEDTTDDEAHARDHKVGRFWALLAGGGVGRK